METESLKALSKSIEKKKKGRKKEHVVGIWAEWYGPQHVCAVKREGDLGT